MILVFIAHGCLELFLEEFIAHCVVLRNLGLHTGFVAVVEDGKHEVEQHVEADDQEANEVQGRLVVHLPERDHNIGEVRRREQHVHVEHCLRDVVEILRRVIVLRTSKQGISNQTEEQYISQNDNHNCK